MTPEEITLLANLERATTKNHPKMTLAMHKHLDTLDPVQPMTLVKVTIPEHPEIITHRLTRASTYDSCDKWAPHEGKAYSKATYTLKATPIRTREQATRVITRVKHLANRPVDEYEMLRILKTLGSGRQYELICLIDRSEELKNTPMFALEKGTK